MIKWVGKNTILYKGELLETDSCEDGWSAYRAMQDADNRRKQEIINALKNLSDKEKEEILRNTETTRTIKTIL